MRRRLPPWLGVAVTVGLLPMCSPTHVNRGSTLYWDGRYIEAAEIFERTERRLAEFSPRMRAEYGLYRGLTFLQLGDVPGARQWLAYAYAVERQAPGTFNSDERGLLDGAFKECEHRTASPLAPPPDAVSATGTPPAAMPPIARPENGKRSVTPSQGSDLVPR